MIDAVESRVNARAVYTLLILVAVAMASGRIGAVLSPEGDTPFLSANDRSRWCTIAALVENGTYEIDSFLTRQGSKSNRRPWGTIDLVQHRGADGQLHYYSSKPPLLPTLYAGVYWCVSRTTGMWLSDHPVYVGRIILWLVNIPALLLFLVCTLAAVDRVTISFWTKCFMAAAVCFATMMMPFTIALNNHLPAAACTALVLFIFVRSLEVDCGWGWWLAAGIAAGFTAANELPALSMTALWAALLLLVRPRALVGYLTGVAIVAIAFFATNWVAHESLRPPYMHRGNGAPFASIATTQPTQAQVRDALIAQSLATDQSNIQIGPSREPSRSRVFVDGQQQFALVSGDDGVSNLMHWDDWYDYPNSYWVDGKRRGVDIGEPSRTVYTANLLVGHYGIFSLTAIWLLVPPGFLGVFRAGLLRKDVATERERDLRLLLASIGTATVVCAVFYVMRPEIDRNYGGVSVCFRWMLWFAPLWLYSIAGPVEWLARVKWGRRLAMLLLASSVFSMSLSLGSPWQSPWLYRFWQYLGWINP